MAGPKRTLSDGSILHFQGVGDAGEWKDLALAMRRLGADGTWTPLRYIEPEHRVRHQVIAGPIMTSDGRILLCCDAGPDGEAGTSLHVSKDGGETWEDTGSIICFLNMTSRPFAKKQPRSLTSTLKITPYCAFRRRVPCPVRTFLSSMS